MTYIPLPYLGTFFSHGTPVWPWPVIVTHTLHIIPLVLLAHVSSGTLPCDGAAQTSSVALILRVASLGRDAQNDETSIHFPPW